MDQCLWIKSRAVFTGWKHVVGISTNRVNQPDMPPFQSPGCSKMCTCRPIHLGTFEVPHLVHAWLHVALGSSTHTMSTGLKCVPCRHSAGR